MEIIDQAKVFNAKGSIPQLKVLINVAANIDPTKI